ncbi:MAG: threonylcarbamoyladenosine tRNA methylthiotransferase MtaB [Candidatus Marinamargulisbacteria bacterium]|jgi:threonylcarbamoyladenosine tRNA methylthiotransferase MtaB
MKKQKISFFTQGCRLNQSETAVLEKGFQKDGHQLVEFDDSPDIVVVNTCTVTENGDTDTRKLVNKINREAPGAKIALVGCQAQIHKEKLLKYPNVKWVIGNAQKMQLLRILSETSNDDATVVKTEKIERKTFVIENPGVDRHHTRANIKIQDGCDFFCSFCVIPFARGPARSRVFGDIFRECMVLVEAGHQEIVLTGINIGTYNYEGKSFLDVAIDLERLEGLVRTRISSIEPTTIPDELIALMAGDNKLCPYLHIPLQAGTDQILKGMARKYTIAEFLTCIRKFEKGVPDICIGTDVIVGFPGETDACFEETVSFLEQAPIHYFHVFSYSERQFARSKKLENPVPAEVIKERSKRLRQLSKQKKQEFMASFVGRTKTVLFEMEKKGYWTGLTDNYIRVRVASPENLENKVRPVKLVSVEDQAMTGHLV